MNHPSKPCFISKGELLDKTKKQEKLIDQLKGRIEGLENTIKHILDMEKYKDANKTAEKSPQN